MRYFLGLFVLVIVSSLAHADTIRREVPANRTSGVGVHGTYSAECRPSAVPRMKVAQAPKNGSVSFKQVSFKLSEDAGRCAGKSVKGTAVYYKPNKGFRGKDQFKVRYSMDMYSHGSAKIRNVVDKYVVEVK
ncbi:MAG: hypothetical protein Tsb0019_26690 [Roseibium sp.]